MNENKRVATQAEQEIAQEKARGKLSYYRLTLDDKEYIRRQLEENIHQVMHYYKEFQRKYFSPEEEVRTSKILWLQMARSMVRLIKENMRSNGVAHYSCMRTLPIMEFTAERYFINNVNQDPDGLSCYMEVDADYAKKRGTYKHSTFPLDKRKDATHRLYVDYHLAQEWKERQE